jgi:hypothetical protein
VLATQGELTPSSVAMLSRVNHKRCRILLEWMQDAGYVRARSLRNKRYFMLTQSGHEYARLVHGLNDMIQISSEHKIYLQNVRTKC